MNEVWYFGLPVTSPARHRHFGMQLIILQTEINLSLVNPALT